MSPSGLQAKSHLEPVLERASGCAVVSLQGLCRFGSPSWCWTLELGPASEMLEPLVGPLPGGSQTKLAWAE